MIKKILVVDDEKEIRDVIKDYFSDTDYVIAEAASAEEALDIVKKESIFVILVDIRLPGMSGLDLCRMIRTKYPLTSLFAITGYSSVYELADCREAGCDDYFMKPLDLSAIKLTVDGAFKKIERWSGHFKQ